MSTIKEQIKRKTSATQVDIIHPETQADVVNNTSANLAGDTVDDVFDNAKPLIPGANISITETTDGVEIGFTGSLSPNVTVQKATGSPITVDANTSTTSATYTVGIQDGTTSQKGAVQLNDATNSTSTTQAATANAVKKAYDLANGKQAAFTDGSATIASANSTTGVVTIKAGVSQSGGAIGNSSGSDITTYTKTKIDSLLTGNAEYLGAGTAINTTTGAITGFATPNTVGDWGRATAEFLVPAAISSSGSSEAAHVGDIVICTAIATTNPLYKWDVLHTEVNTNTWRPIQVDGVDKLSDSSTKINFKAGSNISLTYDSGTLTIANTYSYTHPSYTAADAAAVKVGRDAEGHVVLGGALSKSDVGLGNVKNQAITVTASSVSDGTNTFNRYTHPTEAGYYHLPSGGSATQFLIGTSTSGQGAWTAFSSNGFVKRTASGFTIDTNTYLTANQNVTINSGKKADGSTDITGSASGTTPTLGDSGVSAGTYSAVQVNAKGIVVKGAQVIQWYAKDTTDATILADNTLAVGGLAFVAL